MVQSTGSGRMAAIARLLAPGRISQTVTEDVGYNKLAAQYTHRELCEADEANLLDEDEMDIFGLNPTTDPLNLVRCNACKKPVRASQFAAHAELCRSLSSVEEIVPKHNNGTKRKKPPRKERKKSLKVSAVRPTLTQEREPLETISSRGSAPSSSHLNEQIELISSSNEAKGNAPFVDGLLMMDNSRIKAGFVDRTARAEEPPIKRSKLLAADSQLILDHLGTAKGVTKNLFLNTQEAFTCEYRNGSKIGSGKTSENVVGNQMPRQVSPTRGVPAPLATKISSGRSLKANHQVYPWTSSSSGEYGNGSKLGSGKTSENVVGNQVRRQVSPTRGVPAPLATKIYYSQRDRRLRSAISDLYKASTDECWSDFG